MNTKLFDDPAIHAAALAYQKADRDHSNTMDSMERRERPVVEYYESIRSRDAAANALAKLILPHLLAPPAETAASLVHTADHVVALHREPGLGDLVTCEVIKSRKSSALADVDFAALPFCIENADDNYVDHYLCLRCDHLSSYPRPHAPDDELACKTYCNRVGTLHRTYTSKTAT